MKKEKVRYRVYRQYFLEAEEIENSFEGEYKYVGSTSAVSEAQAINNVRHRLMGDYGTSQYKPLATSGHWENGYNWKAEREV